MEENLFPDGTVESTFILQPLDSILSHPPLFLRSMCTSEKCKVSELRNGLMAMPVLRLQDADDKAQDRGQDCPLVSALCLLLKFTLNKELKEAKKILGDSLHQYKRET